MTPRARASPRDHARRHHDLVSSQQQREREQGAQHIAPEREASPLPWVDFTARAVYYYHYNGAGNWPFNAAYAASRGLVGDVTALHNLREAEPFIRDGIPLVASVAWNSNKLEGGIKSTNGHLMVIGGFTADGSVIAYDPASDNDGLVRHVYDREQFERAWIPASGGIVYVIRPVGWTTPLLTANNS